MTHDTYAETPEEAHKLAMERGADCRNCPLYGTRNGPVMSDVKAHTALAVIQPHPTPAEVGTGQVWLTDHDYSANLKLTQEGQLITDALIEGGVERFEVSVINACGCAPPGGEMKGFVERAKRAHVKQYADEEHPPPFVTPFEACRGMFQNDLREAGGRVLAAVGELSMKAVAREYSIHVGKQKKAAPGSLMLSGKMDEQHGHPLELPDDRILLPTYGTKQVLRQNHLRHVAQDDITRAARIARRGHIAWSEPPYEVFQVDQVKGPQRKDVLATCIQWCRDAHKFKAPIMVDIETRPTEKFSLAADIRCIGMGQLRNGVASVICVPTRFMSGDQIWPKPERKKLAAALRSVFDECNLEFQNGQFDTARLIYRGLMTNRAAQWDDSMVAHHDTRENDCPHSLAFISSRFMEVPLWKTDVDHKAVENIDRDFDLWLYCCRDVFIQMKCMHGLRKWMKRDQTEKAYEVDRKLLPIARNMEELGLFVDLRRQRELRGKCEDLWHERQEQLREIVGDPTFNPRSTKQMKQFLYEDKGFEPQINTDGYKYQDGDGESAGIPALQALQDFGVDEETDKFINTFIKFKQVDKLLSSYLTDKYIQPSPWDDIGRIHPRTQIHVVPSGRFSTKPNVQNWPSRAEFNMKEMLIAPPGHVFVGGDFAQLEVRIHAVKTGDKYTLKAIRENLDAHSLFAAILWADDEASIMANYELMKKWVHGTPEEQEKYKQRRQVAKTFRFLKQYGGEAKKLHQAMAQARNKATGQRLFKKVVPAQVKEWNRRYEKFCPETANWLSEVGTRVWRTGFAVSHFGRKRSFPGGPSKKNAPPNHEIQGTAGDIVNKSMIALNEAIPYRSWSPYTGICLQVHDDIRTIVPEERADEAAEIFTECTQHELEGIPIFAEVEICDRLG